MVDSVDIGMLDIDPRMLAMLERVLHGRILPRSPDAVRALVRPYAGRRVPRCKGCTGCAETAEQVRHHDEMRALMAAPVARQRLGAYRAAVREATARASVRKDTRYSATYRGTSATLRLLAYGIGPSLADVTDALYGVPSPLAVITDAVLDFALRSERVPRRVRLDVPAPALRPSVPLGTPAPRPGNIAVRWDAVCARMDAAVPSSPPPARIDVTDVLAVSGQSWGRETDETLGSES